MSAGNAHEPDPVELAAFDTHYALLGVPITATRQQITEAYKRAMKKWHPDAVPDWQRPEAEELSRAFNAAYAVLADPRRRTEYDREIRSSAIQAQIMNRYVGGLGDQLAAAKAPRRTMTAWERAEQQHDTRRAHLQLMLAFALLVVVLIIGVVIWGALGSAVAALLEASPWHAWPWNHTVA